MTHFILIIMLAGVPQKEKFPTMKACKSAREQYLEVGAKVSQCKERV